MARTCVIQCNLKTSRLERTAFPLKRAGCSVQAEYANFEQRGFIEQTTINGLHFDYAIRFEDQQIKYWYFDIFAKVTSIEQLLKQFYFHIITNNGNLTHKYSLIVCDKQVYDRLSQITIPSLLTHVSIIYYENESFTETTLITACDTNNYEHELSVF